MRASKEKTSRTGKKERRRRKKRIERKKERHSSFFRSLDEANFPKFLSRPLLDAAAAAAAAGSAG